MSNYKVIADVDETLKKLLLLTLKNESSIVTPIITDEKQITFESPSKLLSDTEPNKDGLSLFLYRIVENGDMKNRPSAPIDANRFRYPPLSLNLFYLITPLTKGDENTESAQKDHILLGQTMRVFYDKAIITGSELQGTLADTAEELRIILNPISMEDMTKLWSAFMRPYHLSASYEVKVIYIDSERETEADRVRRKRLEFTQMSGA